MVMLQTQSRRNKAGSSSAAVLTFTPALKRQMPSRVVVINDYSKGGGGAAALARLSALGLKAKGIEVVYFAGDKGEETSLAENGITSFGLNEKPLLESKAFVKGLYNRDAAQALGHWIARNDTPGTIYHLHNWSHILSPSVFEPLRKVSGRVVLSAHDFFLACPNGAFVHYPTSTPCPQKPLSTGCLASSCDKRSYAHKLWRSARQVVRNTVYNLDQVQPRILAIHPGMRPYLERGGIPAELISVLLNPVTPFRTERVAAEENQDFVYVGRLDYEKGVDLAAAAARQAGVKLKVIGDGPLKAELAERYPEVAFLGQQSKEAIAEHIATACALVMPTRYPEPFGLVAVEALWSGLPVILPASSFFAPEIARCDAGLLFEAGNVDSLAEAMTQMQADPEVRHEMSLAAIYNTRHLANTPDEWLQSLLRTYEELLVSSRIAKKRETLQEGTQLGGAT